MKAKDRRKDLEKLAKIVRRPLTDARVVMSMKNAKTHLDGAIKMGAKKGPMDAEARKEAQEALREAVSALHEATEIIIAGIDEMREESKAQAAPVCGIQEVKVTRPKKAPRSRKKATSRRP
jgi:hypothetical protein